MFLNRHKLTRRWGRFKHRRANASLYGMYASHRLDFAWDSRKKNPYAQGKPRAPIRLKILFTVLGVAFFGIIGLILFHPFFAVQSSEIDITGLQRIPKDELVDAVSGIMSHRWLGMVPRNSYAFLNTEEIRTILQQRFPIQSIEIKKVFPHTLRLIVTETLSTMIYDNGTRYALVGANGRVVELLRSVGEDEWMITTSSVSSTNSYRPPPLQAIRKEFGNYPVVYDTRGGDIVLNAVVLSTTTAQGFLDWQTLLERQTTIPILYMILEQDGVGATFKTGEGWDIRARLDQNVPEQFEKLQTILREQKNRSALHYVDVRFRDKVFWQ